MFRWLRADPSKELQRRYEARMADAMRLQRAGDIPRFAEVHAEAQELLAQLDALRGSERAAGDED